MSLVSNKTVLAGVLFAAFAISLNAAISDRLVGHWTFDDTGGFTLVDSTTNANNGSLFNFPTDNSQWVPGKIGGALQFRGPAYRDYVIVPNYPKPSTNLTISVWLWTDIRPPDWAFAMCDWVGSCGQFHLALFGGVDIGNHTATISCETKTVREGTAFPVGSWQHVAIVADGSTIRLFRNGVVVNQVANSATLFQPVVQSFGIGCRPYDDGTGPGSIPWMWQGKIDDLGIWTRALNSQEISLIYNAGLAGHDLSTAGFTNNPEIVTQPRSQLVSQGMDVVLTVGASGNLPLAYQWQSNGTNIPGATSSALNLTNIRENQAGRYRAVVSNALGKKASQPAMITVDCFSILPIFDLLQADWMSDSELFAEITRLKQQVGENRTHFKVGFSTIYPLDPLASTTYGTNTTVAYDLYRRYCRIARENNLSLGLITGLQTHASPVDVAYKDFRNFQWRLNGVTWEGVVDGSGNPLYPDRDYRVVTPSRYATTQRAAFEAIVRREAAEIVALMNEFPDVIVVVNAVIEEELASGGQTNDGYLGDYSPYAVTEFRDWLLHAGKYDDTIGPFAGQGAPASIVGPFLNINGALRSQFYDDPTPANSNGTGQSFNAYFGTSFTRWNLRYWDLDFYTAAITNTSFNPTPQSGTGFASGGFDAPRVRNASNPFWRAWSYDYQDQGNSYPPGNPTQPGFGFRQSMVKNWVNDVLGWIANEGVPSQLLYSHQIPADQLDANRNRSGATPAWTGLLSLNGQLGITRFGPVDIPKITQYSGNWGIFEWHPIPYSTPSNAALYNATMTDVENYHHNGARALFPGWWFKTGTPANPVFPLPDSNFARGLKDWLNSKTDSPLPSMTRSNVIASVIAPSSGSSVTGSSVAFTCYAAAAPNRQVTSVEILANGVSIGMAQKNSGTRNWSFAWPNALPGTNLITARAVDSLANSVTSLPIQIIVSAPLSPTLLFTTVGNQLTLSWSGVGFKLQSATSLSDLIWVDIPGGTNSPFSVPIGSANEFYRLRYP